MVYVRSPQVVPLIVIIALPGLSPLTVTVACLVRFATLPLLPDTLVGVLTLTEAIFSSELVTFGL